MVGQMGNSLGFEKAFWCADIPSFAANFNFQR
jgi:hypothetical protein